MGKNIGVLGGGYVGSLIIDKLLRYGKEVVCMDNFHKGNCDHLFPFIRNKNFKFIRGDINHPEDVEKFYNDKMELVFNTAAIVGFPACEKYQVLAKSTHIDGVKNVLKYRPKYCHLVSFGTDSTYGLNSEFCTEETPLNPQSLYGETKQKAEELVLNEKRVVSLRFSTGMGISYVLRNNLLVNDFVYRAVTDGRLEVFQPEASRSFINVSDMARGAIFFGYKSVNNSLKYNLYNVGSDDLNYTKGKLAELVKTYTNCQLSIISGKDPDCRDYKISHERQRSEGFNPKITMEETIEDLIRAVPLIEWQRKYQ